MFSFKMDEKAFPLEGDLNDVPPAGEEGRWVKGQTIRVRTNHLISSIITHQGKKLEQIILQNTATPLEAKPTSRWALLGS